MVTVYHMKEAAIRKDGFAFICHSVEQALQAMEAFESGKYAKVGEVDTDNLEEAFSATNNIDDSWTKNAGVRSLAGSNVRSTSAGDIMEKDDTFYVVGGFGFYTDPRLVTRVPLEELPPLIGKYPDLDGLIESRLKEEE